MVNTLQNCGILRIKVSEFSKKIFKCRTVKTLYKSVTAKIFKSGVAVKNSPRAEHSNILYGYSLAKGPTIKARNGEFLTFRVGDKSQPL